MPQKKLKVLFVTSELLPFVKVGELANFSSQVTRGLSDLGFDVRILVPKYGCIDGHVHKIHEVIRLKELKCNLGDKVHTYSIKSSFLTNKKTRVQIYFVDSPELFGNRKGVYLEEGTWKDYEDNLERFSLFNRSAFELITKLGWIPDVIHCNDWQTSLIPLYKKRFSKLNPALKNVKTILTVHNFSFQGVFPKEDFAKLELPEEFNNEEGMEIWEKLNFLKAGILYNDFVTSQSRYDLKMFLKDEQYSFGLSEILNKRKKQFFSVRYGLDTLEWDPKNDKKIALKYSVKNLEDKYKNKFTLSLKLNLEYGENLPIMTFIDSYDNSSQSIFNEDFINEILRKNFKLIVKSTNEDNKQYFRKFQEKFPSKINVLENDSNEMFHLLIAGSDFVFMPFYYSPTDSNVLKSLTYGSIPIAVNQGLYADVIDEVNLETMEGNGFVFETAEKSQILNELDKALNIFMDKSLLSMVQKKCMSNDYAWDNVSKEYVSMYNSLLGLEK